MLFFEIQENGRDLSMMKINFNLSKRTTKTETFGKKMKMNILNFKTIRYKLRALGNTFHSIFNYKLMRRVSNLQRPKELKNRKKVQIQEKN